MERGIRSFVVEVEFISVQRVDVWISDYSSTPQSLNTLVLNE